MLKDRSRHWCTRNRDGHKFVELSRPQPHVHIRPDVLLPEGQAEGVQLWVSRVRADGHSERVSAQPWHNEYLPGVGCSFGRFFL
jgi:hypothetical protein